MLILEIDAISSYFKLIDGDNIIITSTFERMYVSDGHFIFYTDDYLYEIPVNKVIVKRKIR